MKINWFSPLPAARSDIANYTRRILPVLSQQAEVVLWTDLEDYDKSLEQYATVKYYKYPDLPWAELNYADVTLYNIGNDARFHGNIVNVAHKHPGIIILHDASVHELALGLLKKQNYGDQRYLGILEAEYGETAARRGALLLKGQESMEQMAVDYTMAEWICSNAHAVITHNSDRLKVISKNFKGPVLYTPLVYASKDELRKPIHRSVDSRKPLQLALFGFLQSENRRLLPVLNALAHFPRKEEIRLCLAGDIKERETLEEEIKRLNIEELVELRGFLSEDELAELLDSSDLAINLRWPSRGEASGSLLRIWNHSLACAVTNTQWYAQQSEDTVVFIDPENEESEIHRSLEEALDDRSKLYDIGLKGREQLELVHSVEIFCQNLMDWIPEAIQNRAFSYASDMLCSSADKILELGFSDLEESLQSRMADVVLNTFTRGES